MWTGRYRTGGEGGGLRGERKFAVSLGLPRYGTVVVELGFKEVGWLVLS